MFSLSKYRILHREILYPCLIRTLLLLVFSTQLIVILLYSFLNINCFFKKNILLVVFRIECPAEFRDTEFSRSFAEFFPGIPPEKSYGIPYFLRNSVRIRNSVLRNSVCYGIPYVTEFRIFTESQPLTVSCRCSVNQMT